MVPPLNLNYHPYLVFKIKNLGVLARAIYFTYVLDVQTLNYFFFFKNNIIFPITQVQSRNYSLHFKKKNIYCAQRLVVIFLDMVLGAITPSTPPPFLASQIHNNYKQEKRWGLTLRGNH